MGKILVILGILGVCFGTENKTDENIEFIEKVYNLEIKDDGSYAPKKRTWQDAQESGWQEKWQRDESGVAKMYEDLSKGKNE